MTRARRQTFTEEQLVAGIAENDNTAIEQVYDQHFRAIEGFILKNSGTSADANDIFQDAFIAVWLNIRDGKFESRSGSSLGGYLFQVARNKWLDRLRSLDYKRTVRMVSQDQEVADENDDFRALEARVLKLEGLYSRLGEKCRQILNKFYYKRKSLEDIGREMHHDAGTVRTMKYRCMQQLRKLHHATLGAPQSTVEQ